MIEKIKQLFKKVPKEKRKRKRRKPMYTSAEHFRLQAYIMGYGEANRRGDQAEVNRFKKLILEIKDVNNDNP